MPTEVIEPFSVVSPAQSGDNAGSNLSNTTSTCNSDTDCEDGSLQTASAYHWRFDVDEVHQDDWTTDPVLEVGWLIPAVDSADTCVTKEFRLEYSTNGGSTWTAFSGFPKTANGSVQSGTASVTLSKTQDLFDLRVRQIVRGSCETPCEVGGDVGRCTYVVPHNGQVRCTETTEATCATLNQGTWFGAGTNC